MDGGRGYSALEMMLERVRIDPPSFGRWRAEAFFASACRVLLLRGAGSGFLPGPPPPLPSSRPQPSMCRAGLGRKG